MKPLCNVALIDSLLGFWMECAPPRDEVSPIPAVWKIGRSNEELFLHDLSGAGKAWCFTENESAMLCMVGKFNDFSAAGPGSSAFGSDGFMSAHLHAIKQIYGCREGFLFQLGPRLEICDHEDQCDLRIVFCESQGSSLFDWLLQE